MAAYLAECGHGEPDRTRLGRLPCRGVVYFGQHRFLGESCPRPLHLFLRGIYPQDSNHTADRQLVHYVALSRLSLDVLSMSALGCGAWRVLGTIFPHDSLNIGLWGPIFGGRRPPLCCCRQPPPPWICRPSPARLKPAREEVTR